MRMTEHQVETRLHEIVAQYGPDGRLDAITDAHRFHDDLGFDSLDSAEFVMDIEDAFDLVIPDHDACRLPAVGDLRHYICKRLRRDGRLA